MTIYYMIVLGLVGLTYSAAPSLFSNFPVGGLSEYSSFQSETAQLLEETLLNGDGDELEVIASGVQQAQVQDGPAWLTNMKSLFFAMLTTLVLMIPVSWVYKSIHQGSDFDHSIDETALVLPAVVAGIVTVVQHSLALAFSLAGIVAGVRFRRALSDTFDTLFIFVAIGVGLAAGVASVEIAFVITLFFNYTTVLICVFGDGLESQHVAQKKIDRRKRKKQRTEQLASHSKETPSE
ncbi:MAG: DUF4956 domain-containing protein [Hyphomonadaceae bacterium]|nr:DUF4956 domain-containing protein [Hyphomonadaceae bacterium]